jgi:conjugal transfer pilin signal peptidase TrbI
MSAAPRRQLSAARATMSLALGLAVVAAWYVGHGRSYLSLTYDPHEVNCLPELHLALLVHNRPVKVDRGDYLFWRASSVDALSYVKEDFVLKRVAGVPGDTLRISGDQVFINDKLVAEGLEDAVMYKRRPADFERTELIPPERYFVVGTARMSNDSRYWGFLPHEAIVGKGYRIY